MWLTYRPSDEGLYRRCPPTSTTSCLSHSSLPFLSYLQQANGKHPPSVEGFFVVVLRTSTDERSEPLPQQWEASQASAEAAGCPRPQSGAQSTQAQAWCLTPSPLTRAFSPLYLQRRHSCPKTFVIQWLIAIGAVPSALTAAAAPLASVRTLVSTRGLLPLSLITSNPRCNPLPSDEGFFLVVLRRTKYGSLTPGDRHIPRRYLALRRQR